MQSRHNATTSRSAEMQKLRFPQKLWIIVNDSNGIAEWSRNGAAICLDIDALDAYLLSDDSIFRTRNHCSFERQMLLYGFQRLGGHTLISGRASFATMEPDEMVYIYNCRFSYKMSGIDVHICGCRNSAMNASSATVLT